MKILLSKITFILLSITSLYSCCLFWPETRPDRCCISNPANDGIQPVSGISILYKRDGRDVMESFNSSMAQPNNPIGFEVNIPNNAPYTLTLSGQDNGGVTNMRLTNVEYKNCPGLDEISPLRIIGTRNLANCLTTNRIFKYQTDAHADKKILYELIVIDNSGSNSNCKLIVIPENIACSQYGTLFKSVPWNSDVYQPKWNTLLRQDDLISYCCGGRIVKASFNIFTDCDAIISLQWHIIIGNHRFDGLNDLDPDNPKHVEIEKDVNITLDECSIEIWSDQFVLTDYSYPNCGTANLPDINLVLTIEP